MLVMHRLRLFHAFLAIIVILAFVTGDDVAPHAWLGYGVAALILIRLIWALTGVPQLGLMRFYPQFEGLKLTNVMTHPAISRTLLFGIAACLIGVTATGIAMDRGRTIGLADNVAISSAHASDDHASDEGGGDQQGGRGEENEGPLSEVHEVLGNLLMMIVALHVSYLLLFKRPLARFMLFVDDPARGKAVTKD